jgi:hypothetical protein
MDSHCGRGELREARRGTRLRGRAAHLQRLRPRLGGADAAARALGRSLQPAPGRGAARRQRRSPHRCRRHARRVSGSPCPDPQPCAPLLRRGAGGAVGQPAAPSGRSARVCGCARARSARSAPLPRSLHAGLARALVRDRRRPRRERTLGRGAARARARRGAHAARERGGRRVAARGGGPRSSESTSIRSTRRCWRSPTA